MLEMSNNHHTLKTRSKCGIPAGEIKHTSYLSEHIGALYLNNNYSDLILKVENEKFFAHKVILAARSEYFRALLYGGMRESSQDEIVITESSVEAFKILLKYIYTGLISLNNLKEDFILEVLGLAHQYGFTDLESSISDYLKQALTIQNCCLIYDSARLYNLKFLMQVSASFIDKHVSDILAEDSFLQLSMDSLKHLISRDAFFATEVEIFRAVYRWIQANSDITPESQTEILSVIRLPLINIKDLMSVVRPTGLVSPDTILDAIEMQTSQHSNTKVKYRGLLQMEQNMASSEQGSVVLQGQLTSALLDGNVSNYDSDRGFTRHAIGDTSGGDPGILVQLGTQCIVNHIKILLWDNDLRSYSYYVEVSMDQKDWTRIIDHTQYFCRSWQYLYFPATVVKYVRIVGTNNTVSKVFHVVHFEIMYTSKALPLEKGLVVPKHNVATCALGASVIEGVSRTRNSLLDGNVQLYDWDSGYTCHQLGSGCILIQLGQPYFIDSMRLLLWDCDDRLYSYFIEVSINMWDWELLVDKSNEKCTSWQTLHFERRPIVFIRITGTQNTANEVFHLVHFECPAQIEEGPTPPKDIINKPESSVGDEEVVLENDADNAELETPIENLSNANSEIKA